MQPFCSRKSLTSTMPGVPASVSRPRVLAVALLTTAAGLGCSSVGDALSTARVDYRTEGARTAPQLDVPPDLTQLGRDLRYQPPTNGTVTATALQTAAVGVSNRAEQRDAAPAVSPNALGDLRVERAGSQRWLATSASPEQLWPKVHDFWIENGFALEFDKPELGIMETNWAENRAKLPQDFIRRSLGRVLDSLYDSGERDRYRTRLERVGNGTEIYISHRGMAEVAATNNDNTHWQPRGSDPELEAEMLLRLMLKLSGKSTPADTTQTAAAADAPKAAASAPELPAATGPVRARVVEGGASALQVDDGFDRAWRRVGLALDRSGFTVEDRDRNAGTYYVRYVDPKFAGKEEPGFFSRLFGSKGQTGGADRYRVVVKAEGTGSLVTVLDSQGQPKTNEATQHIVQLLVADLR